MNIKKIIKNNLKLYIILGVIIILGTIGITFALTTNFNPIAVSMTASNIDAEITYDNGTNSSLITSTGGEMLPIPDSIIEEAGEAITDTRVLKAEFNVSKATNNPDNTIYDVALYANNESGIDCELRTEDVKWKLYKNGTLISNGNLSPTFDVMDNGRLVLTNVQQDLTEAKDKYTFILWISESCTGDITNCDPSLDQSKYLNKKINASLKIELATKTKKELKRTTGEELSCDYTSIDIPACNTLIYNGSNQTLINASSYYNINNNTGNAAGIYKAVLKLNDGYKWSDETITDKSMNCEIKKKEVTITSLPQTITYGSSISTNLNQLSVNGLISGHSIKNALITPTNISTETNYIKVSNVVIIDASNNDVTNNYAINYGNSGTITVGCQNTATLPTKSDQTYTGELLTGITGGNNVDINGTLTASNVGTYEVIITPKNNYCWSDGTTTSKSLTWSIIDSGIAITLNNGVASNNGTSTIYYRNENYYLNNNYTIVMSPTSNPITLPIKVGYVFDGYYTEENGNGTKMIDSNGYITESLLHTITSSTTTLYARWIQKTYTITYDANGGADAPSVQYKDHGKTIALSDVVPTNGEEPFLGWSTDKNAKLGTYSPEDIFTVNANIKLYAIWPKYTDFTITQSNRYMIGYTNETTDLEIPYKFQSEDGSWYKITTIGDNAFLSQSNLKNVTISNGITIIGNKAFSNSSNLKTINIPASITTIGNEALSSYLTYINVDENNSDFIDKDGVLYTKNMETLIKYPCGLLKELYEIPNEVVKIETDAFSYCSIGTISIPASVTTIGDSAFITNNRLKQFIVDENNNNFVSVNGVLYTKNLDVLVAYPKSKSESSFVIPNSVTTISQDAFHFSNNLTEIVIPDSVVKIGKRAFRYTNIINLVIPKNVTVIEGNTFNYCDNLTNITIPNSVKIINQGAFSYCSNITNVYYTGTEEEWNQIRISGNDVFKDANIHFNHIIGQQ